MPDVPEDELSPAAVVFGDWLERRSPGAEDDFEELCRAHPDLEDRLRELKRAFDLFLEHAPASPRGETPEAAIDVDLAQRGFARSRYEVEGEIARGGMGVILRVWDRDLRRALAMKRMVPDASGSALASAVDADRLARFVEEAQLTGRLDHPGIVPVHELGLDDERRVYFTMKLVQGRDLERIFDLVFSGREGWSETRALGVLQKVCEAVAYAHKKGVIHRDLKPANVMVGEFGEVYVMDWGLARVLARAGPGGGRPSHGARPARAPDTPELTRYGDVLGTPAYMPPEQARGELEHLGPRCDVYAIGAMLYHLLARRPPYAASGRGAPPPVLLGPPPPLSQLRPDASDELVSICEKAMARQPELRYGDTLELANDLRAYLEGRVVAAYETGAWAEARKWVRRNRGLAGALASAVALLVAGLTASLYFEARADERAREASEQASIAEANARRASEQESLATAKANDVLSLSAIQDLADLVARAETLWPARAERIPDFEAWLADARALIDGGGGAGGERARPGLADHRRKLADLEARPDAEERDVRWWRGQLSQLVRDLEAFADPSTGLASAGVSAGHGWGVEKRLQSARTLEERSIASPDASARWRAAIASIRDARECPLYGGLEISPQIGLLPIGRDPRSTLWEFAHVETGAPAERGEDGGLVLTEETGIVFVLLPGGSFRMGAQKDDPAAPNFDPQAISNEAPVHEVTLAPFFVSKYEMTQGQCQRFVGINPSMYRPPGIDPSGTTITLLRPIEHVSAQSAAELLSLLELDLPTEAQWEYAARAGTGTPWWTGTEKESLAGAANLNDRYAKEHGGPPGRAYEEWLDDGQTVHAPVGAYRANAFGLHDVAGNVYELCRDELARYEVAVRPQDGLRPGPAGSRVIRGGGFFSSAANARSARRADVTLEYRDFNLGVRPVRRLTR